MTSLRTIPNLTPVILSESLFKPGQALTVEDPYDIRRCLHRWDQDAYGGKDAATRGSAESGFCKLRNLV
jgi:hypothetical protein